MQKRTLERGAEVSSLGFGCMDQFRLWFRDKS